MYLYIIFIIKIEIENGCFCSYLAYSKTEQEYSSWYCWKIQIAMNILCKLYQHVKCVELWSGWYGGERIRLRFSWHGKWNANKNIVVISASWYLAKHFRFITENCKKYFDIHHVAVADIEYWIFSEIFKKFLDGNIICSW